MQELQMKLEGEQDDVMVKQESFGDDKLLQKFG
jgi:hypothetical protein